MVGQRDKKIEGQEKHDGDQVCLKTCTLRHIMNFYAVL